MTESQPPSQPVRQPASHASQPASEPTSQPAGQLVSDLGLSSLFLPQMAERDYIFTSNVYHLPKPFV